MTKHGTKIEWTHFPGYKGETWNPVTGCSPCSIGCENCYAERISKRFGWPWGKPIFHPERLDQPSSWKKPRAIFVCSMSDLFHEKVYDAWRWMILKQIYANPQHLFLILSKRPKRLKKYTESLAKAFGWCSGDVWSDNVWLGVTTENQQTADERIPILLQIPCAHRFVSVEPMLEAIDLTDLTIEETLGERHFDALYCDVDPDDDGEFEGRCIDWIIAGGESGPGARPMHPDWARSLRDQCQTAGVPFFFKQHGEWLATSQILSNDGTVYGWMHGHARECVIDHELFYKVGKKAAGRFLDGREWNEFPEVNHE